MSEKSLFDVKNNFLFSSTRNLLEQHVTIAYVEL